MPRINFTEFPYYPALQLSSGEHIGYRELPVGDKQRLLPIFELSQRGDETNLKKPRGCAFPSARSSLNGRNLAHHADRDAVGAGGSL